MPGAKALIIFNTVMRQLSINSPKYETDNDNL